MPYSRRVGFVQRLAGQRPARSASSEFEQANDEVARAAARLEVFDSPVPFFCECPDRDCFQRVEMSLAEYEEHRADEGTLVAHTPDLRLTRSAGG